MKKSNFWKRCGLFAALIFIAPLLAACIGGPTTTTWGSLSLLPGTDNILFAFGDKIVMLDPTDGQPVPLLDEDGDIRIDDSGNQRTWQVSTTSGAPAQFFTAPIQISDETLLAVSWDRGIFEIDIPTARLNDPSGVSLGAEVQVVANSLLDNDLLFVPYSGNNMSARSMDGFDPVWTLDTNQGVWSQPLLVDETLYIASLDHNLYALDPDTGDIQWQIDMGGAMTSAPLYQDGYLYIGTFNRNLQKISLESASVVASYTTNNWVWGTPALVDGVLYFGDVSGYLYVITDDGDSFSDVLPPRQVATNSIVATPLVTESSIIVGSRDKNLYWLDRETGETTATRQMNGEVLGNMLLLQPGENSDVNDDIVVVSTLTTSELVVAFTAENGERLWVYSR